MTRGRSRAVVRRLAQAAGTGLFVGGLVLMLAILVWPLARPLLLAVILAIACAPVQRGWLWVLRGREGPAALLTTVVAVLVVVLPSIYLGSALVVEAEKAYEELHSRVTTGAVRREVDRMSASALAALPRPLTAETLRRIEAAVADAGASVLKHVSGRLGGLMNGALANMTSLAVDVLVLLLSLYLFLRDGKRWIAAWKDSIPLPPELRALVGAQLHDTTRAVVHGMLLAAVAQALMLGAGFWMFGVPLPVLFGVAGFFVSLVPFIGAATLWLPASLWLWLGHDDPVRAAGLFAYGAVLVSSVDNLIAPLVIGNDTRLPAYAMLLAILGGLYALGPLGLFIGPAVFAVGIAVAGAYRETVTRRRGTKV